MSFNKLKISEENRVLKSILFNIVCLIFLVAVFVSVAYLINIESVKNIRIIQDIDGISYIVGFLAVLCCGVYYYVYKSDEFYFYILSFISIYLEYLVINIVINGYISSSSSIETNIIFPFLFRMGILSLAVFNKSKIAKKVASHKKLVICIDILITIMLILLEFYLRYLKLEFYWMIRNPYIQLVLIACYYGLLIKIGLKYLKNKDYIYLIMFLSISIFNFRRIISLNIMHQTILANNVYSRVIALLGFTVLILGLFLQIKNTVERNRILNYQIISTEIEFDKMKEIESVRSQFFANLSHELKTPINIMYSTVQLLEKEKEKSLEEFYDCYNKYENTIKQNCFRMLRLSNNMVDITKFEAGFFKMNYKNCEIVSLVENITFEIASYVKNKGINIIFDTYVEELEIKCDAESIERVILNILSNSVKFTSKNGNIMVTMSVDDEWIYISIADDGIGISKEYKDKIFEKFVQADKSLNRAQEGCGIGLSLVKAIIEMHNGSVFVKDNSEIGTEVIVKLPNIKCVEKEENKHFSSYSKNVIDRISIEFSDIYDI